MLAAEEDLARELVRSLALDQRERATLPFEDGRGLFLGDGRQVTLEGPPLGIARADLEPPQRARLDALIDLYLDNLADEIASARRAEIERAGRDGIHFVWAGSTDLGEPCYYRIRGPTFLIEYDDSLDGADHVHTLLRDFRGDFGRDLLERHYSRAHRARWEGGS